MNHLNSIFNAAVLLLQTVAIAVAVSIVVEAVCRGL